MNDGGQPLVFMILGMHRSGTSLMAGLLDTAGVYFGNSSDFVRPNEENPKGFREHLVLRSLNDNLLNVHSCDWAEISGFRSSIPSPQSAKLDGFYEKARSFVQDLGACSGGHPIGIKDPRLCLLAPFWYRVVGDRCLTILVQRAPEEIARSLEIRNAMPQALANYLTEQYLYSAIASLKDRPYVIVSFEKLIRQPHREMARINQALEGFGLNPLAIEQDKLADFVDPGLYRSNAERPQELPARLLDQWHDTLNRDVLPRLPPSLDPPSREILAYEHAFRFEKWRSLEKKFRQLESRYIALTRADRTHKRPVSEPGKLSRQARRGRTTRRPHLESDFLMQVLPDSPVADSATLEYEIARLEESKTHVEEQLADTAAKLVSTNSALEDARTQHPRLRKKLKKAKNRVKKLNAELKSTRVAGARQASELQTRHNRIMVGTRKYNEDCKAHLLHLANKTSGSERLDAQMAKTATRFGEIRDSVSWKIAEKSLRLMMAPTSLGFGETSLDLLYESFGKLENDLRQRQATFRGPGIDFEFSEGIQDDQHGISIIVLNRDGAGYLNKLFSSYLRHHRAKLAEWVVVDHASDDESRKVIRHFMEKLPIKLILLDRNDTFSRSNNLATHFASGSNLVFCNNDIIFDRPVIRQLVGELVDPEVGIVGLPLYYPNDGKGPRTLQHAGILFEYDERFEFPRPVNHQQLDAPGRTVEYPAVTAALMACRTNVFVAVGGFNEGYDYGYEDVDLSVTIRHELNKKILLSGRTSAIHDESASQKTDASGIVAKRRRGNIQLFRSRYAALVARRFMEQQPRGEDIERTFRLGLVVTDDDPDTTAGDFFTGSEIAHAVESEFGWSCTYLPRRGDAKDWYDCSGLDAILVLIDAYDLGKIKNAAPNLLKIAWLRNWFDRWVKQPWFNCYDLALCSSERAGEYVSRHSAVKVEILRIATNPDTFSPEGLSDESFATDYCFTGSYWNARREIEDLNPDALPYRFGLYGAGWEGHKQFSESLRGTIPYRDIPKVYANTRIVIDDANHVTRPWGSVNSRVFDALASGTLVLSNGVLGAEETFGGMLPTWTTAEELEAKIRHYLENDEERCRLASLLRDIVKNEHTYTHRARMLKPILDAFTARPRIAIKLPVPRWEIANEWGDFHFGSALARSLEKLGYWVRLDILPDWYEPGTETDDVVIVLRGLSRYEVRPHQLNIMWNISHPDKVPDEEYEQYDHVFVASMTHAETLDQRLKCPVSPLLQCTDPERFQFDPKRSRNDNVLFVGNSRGIMRAIVQHAVEAGIDLKVYGTHWEKLIDEKFIAGEHIDNAKLVEAYAGSSAVLNDHWQTMRECGFLSNRLFDLAACGAIIVTDRVPGAEAIFGDAIYEYDDTPDGLKQCVDTALANADETSATRETLACTVAKDHGFNNRAQAIHQVIEHRLRTLHAA